MSLNNNAVHKTIYSPSISGYVEPKSASYSYFEGHTIGSWNNGWWYDTNNGNSIFFYGFGLRVRNAGNLSLYGQGSHYWSAGPASATTAYDLRAYPDFITPQYPDEAGYGFNIRSVKDI